MIVINVRKIYHFFFFAYDLIVNISCRTIKMILNILKFFYETLQLISL